MESSISDWLPRLPEPKAMLSFARASMAVQTAWEVRYQEPCDPVATMRVASGVTSFEFPTGDGDHLVLCFGEDWALVIAYDHESAKGPWRHLDRAPTLWPGMLQDFPDRLRPWLHSAHDVDGVFAATAIAWHLGDAWIAGEDFQTDIDIILEYDDGVASLLDPFVGGVSQLTAELNHDYELNLDLSVVQQLVSDAVLPLATIETLCPSDASSLIRQLEQFGYRIAAT